VDPNSTSLEPAALASGLENGFCFATFNKLGDIFNELHEKTN